MRIVKSGSITGAVMVILAACFFGCSSKPKTPAVDVVNGIPPVSTSLAATRTTIEELARLPPGERAARLQREFPHLAESVVYYARINGLIPRTANVETVRFLFGSLENIQAADRSGAMHPGYAKNQLVARLKIAGRADPLDLFVLCLNGLVARPGQLDSLQSLNGRPPIMSFTIGRGEGLIHHVDELLAIDLAEQHHLPLFRGKKMDERYRITPAQARAMLPNTDRVQVTVKVKEGAKFDLLAGTYTPPPEQAASKRSRTQRTSKRLHSRHARRG